MVHFICVINTHICFSPMYEQLTLAGLAVGQQPVSIITATVITVEHTHTLMIATVVPKRTVVDH